MNECQPEMRLGARRDRGRGIIAASRCPACPNCPTCPKGCARENGTGAMGGMAGGHLVAVIGELISASDYETLNRWGGARRINRHRSQAGHGNVAQPIPSSVGRQRTSPSAMTAQKILDVAEALVQTRGYNAFSYADIAAVLAVTKASLHYHFAHKADLGVGLIARYAVNFTASLDDIARTRPGMGARLIGYVEVYDRVLREDRTCLSLMLAAEFETLPPAMRAALRAFFDRNELWLADVLEAGRNAGDVRFTGAATDMARMLLSALQGGMILARFHRDPTRLGGDGAAVVDRSRGSDGGSVTDIANWRAQPLVGAPALR